MSEGKDHALNGALGRSDGDEEYEELEDEETEEDVFNIPPKPTVESLKRWRVGTLASFTHSTPSQLSLHFLWEALRCVACRAFCGHGAELDMMARTPIQQAVPA